MTEAKEILLIDDAKSWKYLKHKLRQILFFCPFFSYTHLSLIEMATWMAAW